MMTVAEVWQWIGMVVAGAALVSVAAVAYLALLRWLIVIVPVIVLVGFAFEPQLQMRFTAALLGVLGALYLPPLILARVWRQVARARLVTSVRINPPSAMELVHQTVADDMVRETSEWESKAARDARDRDDRDSRARDLERQGMVSLWNRQ